MGSTDKKEQIRAIKSAVYINYFQGLTINTGCPKKNFKSIVHEFKNFEFLKIPSSLSTDFYNRKTANIHDF